MNKNEKFLELVSQIQELVETGLVEIKVTRSTSTGYGLGNLEAALQKQVEVQTVHTLPSVDEDLDSEYVKCFYSLYGNYHIVGDVYRVIDKKEVRDSIFRLELEDSKGERGNVTNINFRKILLGNATNYTHATADEFYAQKETVESDTSEKPIKRIIFTIMGLDNKLTLQRKIEICKQRINEIKNIDETELLKNSDNLIEAMDGWFGRFGVDELNN